MTMHLMSPQFTTTSTRKRKAKNKTKSQIQAEKDHEKFLKRMGVHPDQRKQKTKHSGSSAVEQRVYTPSAPDKRQVVGSNPTRSTNNIGYNPTMAKKEANVYTGTEIIGISQMHKSNAVPIRSKKAAVEVAKMRRG